MEFCRNTNSDDHYLSILVNATKHCGLSEKPAFVSVEAWTPPDALALFRSVLNGTCTMAQPTTNDLSASSVFMRWGVHLLSGALIGGCRESNLNNSGSNSSKPTMP